MKIKDKIILVTGGANGIGKGLCERFAQERAEKIIVTDIDFANANKVAKEINGLAYELDVSNESQVKEIVTQILQQFGRIDIVCSNAGIGGAEGCLDVSNDVWQKIYEVNVLSHVYLARAVFPAMIERGEGYFLITSSAAGLLTHPTAAPYVVTKHGAIALAESLSIEYHDRGIRVSCLCPQGVKTNLILGENNPNSFLHEGAISTAECAEAVIKGLESEKFLILPHEEVAQFIINKAENRDRWLHSLRKIRTAVLAARSK